jgi:hypothetical protein
VQPLWKSVWRILKKLKIDLAVPFLGTYPTECKSEYNRDSCTVVKLCNQPRCPSTNEWIKKMWYIYKMEGFPAIKKNEIMSFSGKWIEIEIIISRKISQTETDKCQTFFLIYGICIFLQNRIT